MSYLSVPLPLSIPGLSLNGQSLRGIRDHWVFKHLLNHQDIGSRIPGKKESQIYELKVFEKLILNGNPFGEVQRPAFSKVQERKACA